MSRLFNQHYFENPEQWHYDQGYRQSEKDLQSDWQYFEYLQQGYYNPPANRFVLADGTIIEGGNEA